MATTTTNYGLTKPDSNDNYDVAVQNGNMDTIDARLKVNADRAADTWPRADVYSATTAALYPGAETPDEALAAIGAKLQAVDKNMLNILRVKLNLALSTSDIDAWADVFDGTGGGALSGGGRLTASGSLRLVDVGNYAGATNGSNSLGDSSSYTRLGQTMISPGIQLTNATVTVKINMSKYGTPTDNVLCHIYSVSSTKPSSLLYSSTAIAGSSLTTSFVVKEFIFTGVTLAADTQYAIVFSRSGSLNATNYYNLQLALNSISGAYYIYNGSTWTAYGDTDMYLQISVTTLTMIWGPLASTEALAYMAVAADQDEGAGTITWYLSDDGTNWTEVTALDTVQQVDFDAAAVYLKCVLTGDAVVNAVAWGGY